MKDRIRDTKANVMNRLEMYREFAANAKDPIKRNYYMKYVEKFEKFLEGK